jgi:hypothetical protein
MRLDGRDDCVIVAVAAQVMSGDEAAFGEHHTAARQVRHERPGRI